MSKYSDAQFSALLTAYRNASEARNRYANDPTLRRLAPHLAKMALNRGHELNRKDAAITLQSAWRGRKARHAAWNLRNAKARREFHPNRLVFEASNLPAASGRTSLPVPWWVKKTWWSTVFGGSKKNLPWSSK